MLTLAQSVLLLDEIVFQID